jgi:hypothetical protein
VRVGQTPVGQRRYGVEATRGFASRTPAPAKDEVPDEGPAPYDARVMHFTIDDSQPHALRRAAQA